MTPVFYQIHYRPEQRAHLDPLACPFDNTGVAHPLLEFNVFERLHAQNPGALWGALSWKFTQKTGLTLADLQAYIAAHPGADVYFCNPFPETEAYYHNLWQQGQTCHPQFLPLCERFFQAAGLDTRHLVELLPAARYAATNYFVGTPAFWSSYLTFVRAALTQAEANMAPADWSRLRSSAADAKGAHAGACYLPFIVERLFSLWLQQPTGLRAAKYPVQPKTVELSHVTVLRALKERAIQDRSNLLAVGWANYRNLHLADRYGAAWARAVLPAVTPTRLVFPS